MVSPLVAAGIVLAGLSSPAEAQIFSWRDANGSLVLSNTRPQDVQSIQSYAVPASEGVRATRDVPTDRVQAYDDLILEHSRRNGLRPSLVRAVVQVESAFNPTAYSDKGAMGLMQLMPATARQFGVRNAFNPDENVRGGTAYLRQLLDRYGDNEELALAAYNAGPGAVDKHGHTIPPYRETRNYVSKVNGIAGHTSSPVKTPLYKTIEVIDGHEVVKYTDKKPQESLVASR